MTHETQQKLVKDLVHMECGSFADPVTVGAWYTAARDLVDALALDDTQAEALRLNIVYQDEGIVDLTDILTVLQ